MSNIIKIGTSEPSVIKIGTTSVAGVYVGTVKVYPQQAKDYLRTVARGTGEISLTIGSAVTTTQMTSISYSLDGYSWTTLNNADNTAVAATVNVASGDTVYWKGIGVQTAIAAPSYMRRPYNATIFSADTAFDVEGNAMSMLFDDNFEGEEFDSGTTYHLSGLFYSATTLVNASGMTLPATTVYENDYNDMFNGCSNLLTPPELLATTIGASCYKRMFQGCTSLSTSPELLATTLAAECYSNMFNGCSSLTTAPTLPAPTLAERCYSSMFYGCSGLTESPALSATTLNNRCYETMFYRCASLSAITCLATTNVNTSNLGDWVNGVAANGVFTRNSSMTGWTYGNSAVPSGWTVTPPYYAWNKADVSDYVCDAETYTKYYKEYYQESFNLGNTWQNVTPVQWRQSSDVIEYQSPDCGYVPPLPSYFTITSLAANNVITLKNNRRQSSASTFSYSTDNGTTWSTFSLSSGQTQTIATLASGDTLMMYGDNTTLGTAYNYGHYFRGSADYEVSGELSSLVNGSDVTDTYIASGASRTNTFAQLFSGDTHLVSAENLLISSTALPNNACNSMFRGCTNLVKAPTTLPSTILGTECYSSMFESCTSLAYPPAELYFTSVNHNSYNRMFCMSRNSKVTAAMTESPKMFGNWGSVNPATNNMQMFCGNGSLETIYCYWTNTSGTFGNIANWVNYTDDTNVTFYKRSTQSFASGVNGIKDGWTVVNDDTTGY